MVAGSKLQVEVDVTAHDNQLLGILGKARVEAHSQRNVGHGPGRVDADLAGVLADLLNHEHGAVLTGKGGVGVALGEGTALNLQSVLARRVLAGGVVVGRHTAVLVDLEGALEGHLAVRLLPVVHEAGRVDERPVGALVDGDAALQAADFESRERVEAALQGKRVGSVANKAKHVPAGLEGHQERRELDRAPVIVHDNLVGGGVCGGRSGQRRYGQDDTRPVHFFVMLCCVVAVGVE